MSQLRVVTWNAEGMFVTGTKTRRATPHAALETLRKLDADIVVVPEFGRLSELKDEVSTTIRALGYEMATLSYDEPRTPGLGFAILSRLPIVQTFTHQLDGSKRQVLETVCRTEDAIDVSILGAHLDDRSERGRLVEIKAIADIVNAYADAPLVLLGDFNAMHQDSWFARIARSRLAHGVSRHVSHTLIRSIADRVQQMALGTTVEFLLTHTSLHDLDPGRKRTISSKQAGLEWMPSWRLAKIDWMFASKQVETVHYRVFGDVGSDHRPVIADITIDNKK